MRSLMNVLNFFTPSFNVSVNLSIAFATSSLGLRNMVCTSVCICKPAAVILSLNFSKGSSLFFNLSASAVTASVVPFSNLVLININALFIVVAPPNKASPVNLAALAILALLLTFSLAKAATSSNPFKDNLDASVDFTPVSLNMLYMLS